MSTTLNENKVERYRSFVRDKYSFSIDGHSVNVTISQRFYNISVLGLYYTSDWCSPELHLGCRSPQDRFVFVLQCDVRQYAYDPNSKRYARVYVSNVNNKMKAEVEAPLNNDDNISEDLQPVFDKLIASLF